MNSIWSKYVQGINTLYLTRKLRFDDMFKDRYKPLFALNEEKPLRILEIGCGPGTLAGALLRWYPNARITAVDRDSDFIAFAKENEKGIEFLEGDATNLPFEDNTFDVTVSNTVAEHIDPERFYGEQYRVLKSGGVCLVLSARRGITVSPSCITASEFENAFWERAREYDSVMEKYAVCKYPMSEAELPAAMEKHHFQNVSTGYLAVSLTPDDPAIPRDMAHRMINTQRAVAVDTIMNVANTLPELFTDGEIEKMTDLANGKYDLRLKQYDSGEKQWDTSVSLTMVVRGVE